MLMHDIFGLLRRSGLRDWGICSFEQVCGSLLDCRAKSRIPELYHGEDLAIIMERDTDGDGRHRIKIMN